MYVIANEELWSEALKGFVFSDCTVVRADAIALVAEVEETYEQSLENENPQTKFIAVIFNETETKLTRSVYRGMTTSQVGSVDKPENHGLWIRPHQSGKVRLYGSGKKGEIEHIDESHTSFFERMVNIEGYAYSVGTARRIYKRTAPGTWELINPDMPKPLIGEELARAEAAGEPFIDFLESGFLDMDGFSENDLYAVGGDGDVWHFNGNDWRQMGFPSNEQINTVCCGGDGAVYIGGEGCGLWKGRESSWERILNGGSTILWNDLAWFDGKLWATSDYNGGYFDAEEGRIKTPTYANGKPRIMHGTMDVGHGWLLFATRYEAVIYDGTEFYPLIQPYV